MDENKTTNTNNRENEVATSEGATSFGTPKTGRENNNRLVSLDNRPMNSYIPSAIDDDDEEENENLENEEEQPEEANNSEANNNNASNDVPVEEPSAGESGQSLMQGFGTLIGLKEKIIIIGVVVLIFLFLFLIYATISGYVGDELKDLLNSNCDAETEGNVVTFIAGWECGGIDNCPNTCTVDGQDGWFAADFHDNAITIGPGMTNWVVNGQVDVANYINQNGWGKYFIQNGSTYNLPAGKCIPKDVVEKLQLYVIETQFGKAVEQAMEKYDVELTQYQKDALTSLGYTHGAYKYADQLVKAYKDGGYEGLWSVMKNCIKAGYETGFMKRSKGEFALFVTGDYSDQGLFYNRTLENYDDYNSEGVMDRKLVCNDEVSTNYTKVTSNGLNDVLTQTLKSKLEAKNTSCQEFNEYILRNVIKAGVGTRDGVVAAAVSLVGGLYEKYQIRIPYTYAGQHGGYLNGVRNPISGSFYGVDPLWGSSINYYYGDPVYRTYYYYGPDCSGFVMWALYNGGMSTNYPYTPRKSLNGQKVGKPGDLMWHPGHIMLVVGVNEEEKQYYIAHASGGDQGVKISTVSFSDSSNYIIDMDSFYANSSNKLYTDSDRFATAFRAGQL